MKNILIILTIALFLSARAQVTVVSIKASGLTCSMCSNAINKSLKTLDCVESLESDIKTYTFIISIKPNSIVDFEKIKKKVEDAGFSVSSFTATIHFDNVAVRENEPVVIGNNALVFVHQQDRTLNGLKEIKILGKGFVTAKEYKNENLPLLPAGLYHASI